MSWVEILGYIASGAVFVTFWMKTIISLRLVAIVGNALYLAYGVYADLGNIILLHGSLLPLNCLRLHQSLKFRKKLREMARADFDVQGLLPLMARTEMKRDTVLFKQGDDARDIYYLLDGRVLIEEIGQELGPGHLIGEIAMFAPDKTRTQSARCMEDCTFLRLTEEKALELYTDNPEFGLYLTKMMVARLLENSERERSEAGA